MQRRNVGQSGLRVSTAGLGCNNLGWTIPEDESARVIRAALDSDITFFDLADTYGDPQGSAEECLGRNLGPDRHKVVIATKFGLPLAGNEKRNCASRRYVMAAVEASLKRLNTDWIDVFMLHAPDPSTPIEETLRALDDLVRQGKVRYIGCSNLTAWRLVEAILTSRLHGLERFILAQNEYSLLSRGVEAEIIPVASQYGLGFIPFFPLASGLLTGKYGSGTGGIAQGRLATNLANLGNRFMTDRNVRLVGQLAAFADERGRSMLELAFGWLLSQPNVPSVIAGATSPEQVAQNVAACEWRLSAEELSQVDSITTS